MLNQWFSKYTEKIVFDPGYTFCTIGFTGCRCSGGTATAGIGRCQVEGVSVVPARHRGWGGWGWIWLELAQHGVPDLKRGSLSEALL